MESSPLHTQLLKRTTRRYICSSDEEPDINRPVEVLDTPSDSLQNSCADGGSCPQATIAQSLANPDTDDETGIVIIQETHIERSPWNTDDESDTSTPSFKRRNHTRLKVTASDHSPCDPDPVEEDLHQKAVHELLQGGMRVDLPSWIRGRGTRQRVVILADSLVSSWPSHDNICAVEYHAGWSIKRWTECIRNGSVRIPSCHTVVLYLEYTQHWDDVLTYQECFAGPLSSPASLFQWI